MLDLDNVSIQVQCPRCEFYNSFFMKQARLQDVIICRGCHCNIFLNDQIGECQKVIRRVEKALWELEEQIKNTFPITINIKL